MQSPHIIILAAGQGKRMQSSLPKILHPVLFRPMIHYVLELAQSIPHRSISMIVGHGEGEVRANCAEFPDVTFLHQKEQLGTGHAVRMAESQLAGQSGTVVILSGDVILLQKATLEGMLGTHEQTKAVCTLVTARPPIPKGYGRILRDSRDQMTGIREEADCSVPEREIGEVNTGLYCFDIASLFTALGKITNQNKQNEYYLPDTLKSFVAEKKTVATYTLEDSKEMIGINDRAALAEVQGILQARVNHFWMMQGVTLTNPATTAIDSRSKLGRDIMIEGGCTFIDSQIESGVTVEANSRIVASRLGEQTVVKQGSYIENSEIGKECSVGPYAHLRPGSRLGDQVKIGNFVELKKANFGNGAKAAHLSYIGDAEIGKNVNLGCGFITCNYDGREKHQTIIGDNVFVGSDSQTVAPVRIGKNSYVASGTTVTQDVPEDSLVISRGRQTVKQGYGRKYFAPKK